MSDTTTGRTKGLVRWLTVLDFGTIFLIGVLYILDGLFTRGSPEQYKMLLSAIGLTATLSALCFRTASVTKEEPHKGLYADGGRRLFQAVILFTFATIMRYVYGEAASFRLGDTGTLVIQVLAVVPSICAFLLGLYLAVTAISTAYRLLTE